MYLRLYRNSQVIQVQISDNVYTLHRAVQETLTLHDFQAEHLWREIQTTQPVRYDGTEENILI